MRRRFIIFCSLSVVLFLFLFSFYNFKHYQEKRKVEEQLKENVNSLVNSFNCESPFLIKLLSKDGIILSYRDNKKLPAASLIKIPVMVAVLFAAKEGKVSLGKLITLRKKDITTGSGILKHKKLPYTISIGKLLECMIAYSDNTATNKFIDILGFDYINVVFEKIGLKDTVLQRRMMDFYSRKKGLENYTSCRDMGYLLEKMYKGELISPFYSQLMILLLKRQVINDRIPKYLPPAVTVAHKTGLERSIVADVGIVFSNSCNYIICVMVDKFKNYKEAKDFIAKLSLVVYNTLKDYKS